MRDSGLQQQGGREGGRRRSIHSRKAAAALPQCTTRLYCNPPLPGSLRFQWIAIWNHLIHDHPLNSDSDIGHACSGCCKWMVSGNMLYPLNSQLWHRFSGLYHSLSWSRVTPGNKVKLLDFLGNRKIPQVLDRVLAWLPKASWWWNLATQVHTTDSEEQIIKIETWLKQAVALTGGGTGCNVWLYTRPRLTAGNPWKLTRTSRDACTLGHMLVAVIVCLLHELLAAALILCQLVWMLWNRGLNMSHIWIYEFRPTV